MRKNSYLYSINPDDENVYAILHNIVGWEIPFALSKGAVGDIIYIYVTGVNSKVDSFLNYYQRVGYSAEIINIEEIAKSKKKAVKLKVKELSYYQTSQLTLSEFRKKIEGFHPSQSYPIDLQEPKYLDLKTYIEDICKPEIISTEDEIINTFRKYVSFFIKKFNSKKPRSWVKLQGDISLRLIRELINIELNNSDYETSDVNAYIAGFSTEFDLLIVKKKSKPLPYSNIYKPDDVKTIIEVKTSGIIASKKGIYDVFKRMKLDIDQVKSKYNNMNYVYITIFERASTKHETSMNYFDMTKKGLYPYNAFCIFDVHNDKIISGEWNKFINAIK